MRIIPQNRAMTKTEAAEIIANDVVVFARKNNVQITKTLAEERVSEFRGETFAGTYKGIAARLASPVTVLRIAKKWSI